MAAVKDDAALVKGLKRQVAMLEKQAAELETQLKECRRAKFSLPTGDRRGGRAKSFCRVIIPDSHGRSIDPAAAKAFLNDLEAICPQEVVWLGDHLDCSGFLSKYNPLYLSETEYTFEDDAAACNVFMDEVAVRAPKADQYFLEGNHEHRIEQFLINATLRNRADAAYLNKFFSVKTVLNLDARKVRYFERGVIHGDVSIPGMIRLGKCHFMHGEYTSKNAASAHVNEYVVNVVYGHTHRQDSSVRRTAYDTFGAWCPGALAKEQSYYAHTRNTHHTLGYGLQAVQADGSFLHLNIPIIGGVSYLRPLASKLGV